MAKTIKGVPLKDFRDAGTKKNFTKSKTAEFTEGEHAIYLAAGLIKPSEAEKSA